MKAKYETNDRQPGVFSHPVIIPNGMQHADGFTLLGFDSWEEVHDEKFCAAVTNVASFHITKESMGFNENQN